MKRSFVKDSLRVGIYESRAEMGAAAAADVSACISALMKEKPFINTIFAAAPSQNEVLASLAADKSICWERINAFHMDEYIGLDRDAPQGFGNFMKEHLFGLVPFATVNLISCEAEDAEAECKRYASLLAAFPPDIVVMGIGENGHIAFNDPPVADFKDPLAVKPVPLDPVCRQQQVNDGCFARLDDVPLTAITLTVPTLVSAPHLFCVVPASTKAEAVKKTVEGSIGEHCPATALRLHPDATLYLDPDSSALLG